jgi:hypothetical protein
VYPEGQQHLEARPNALRLDCKLRAIHTSRHDDVRKQKVDRELASEPFAAPDRLSGVAQQLQRAGFVGPALEHLEIAEDGREQIVEVVRTPAVSWPIASIFLA